MKHIFLSLVLLVGLSEVSYSQDKKNKWLENLKKVKDKVENFMDENPDLEKKLKSGENVTINIPTKSKAEKAREDSIKKAESDSVVNVLREAVIEQLYLKWGPKKKTTVDTVKN